MIFVKLLSRKFENKHTFFSFLLFVRSRRVAWLHRSWFCFFRFSCEMSFYAVLNQKRHLHAATVKNRKSIVKTKQNRKNIVYKTSRKELACSSLKRLFSRLSKWIFKRVRIDLFLYVNHHLLILIITKHAKNLFGFAFSFYLRFFMVAGCYHHSKIREEGLNNTQVMDIAFQPTEVSGLRVTGSPDKNVLWLCRINLNNGPLRMWF